MRKSYTNEELAAQISLSKATLTAAKSALEKDKYVAVIMMLRLAREELTKIEDNLIFSVA